MDIKQEDPLLEGVASQNEAEFFTKVVTMKTNSDAVLLDDVAIKTEIKSGNPFPELCSQKEGECFTRHFIQQNKSERFTCSKKENEEETLASDFGSLNGREFFPENPVMKIKECNSEQMNSKIEIKEEPWWLETETSSVCDDIKDEDFPPVESSRLCTTGLYGDSDGESSLSPAEVSGRDAIFYIKKNRPEFENQESDVVKVKTVEHVHSEQSITFSDGEIYSRTLYPKQKSFNPKGKRSNMCTTCGRRFTHLPHLKRHGMIHEGKKPHMCKICDKRFTQFSTLKRHNLIHEGKKPHQCKTCGKRFTQLSDMRTHSLIHEGTKPHQCKTCDKSFTHLSTLRRHSLIHENRKLHQCKTCDKSFTRMSNLRRHNLIHECEKSH